VRSAAVVGVGPAGTQAAVAVVVPTGSCRRAVRASRRRRPRLAGAALADAVRSAAGVGLAAVLVVDELPLDIRHASKIDRAEVARRAARVLAGG
jgi:hypothetical protein